MARGDVKLAEKLRDALRENPDLTIAELASAVAAPEPQVTEVLDEYAVEGAKVKHVGPGRGGGWIA